jgi:hypothetical protein
MDTPGRYAAKGPTGRRDALPEQEHPAGVRRRGRQVSGLASARGHILYQHVVRHRMQAARGATAARRSSSVGGAWLALASCRSLKASSRSCIAWLGMPASALAWAAHLIRHGWPFGRRTRNRRFGRLLSAITLATPNDRVAGDSAAENYRARRPDRRTPRFGPTCHLNVRSARLRHCEPWERDDSRTSGGRSQSPRPRAGLTGTGGPPARRPPRSSPIHADGDGLESHAALSASPPRGVLAQHTPRRRRPD